MSFEIDYNPAHIVKLRMKQTAKQEIPRSYVATFTNGETETIDGLTADDIMAGWGFVIPAQPGWFLLGKGIDADGEGKQRDYWTKKEVLAWRITGANSPMPVTLDDVISDADPLLSPSGEVFLPHHKSWDTFENFLQPDNHRW
jgi:hypothetical protein